MLQAVKSGFFVMENRRFCEKKTAGKQFGFSSGILIDKIEANGAPGNALTAPEDQRLAPQSPLRETAVAGDAQS